ncbi:MAG: DUF6629 family protein [Bacteroidota bacterium]
MCFSAEASFAGGIALTALGAVTMKKVQQPTQMAFAAVPVLFGVQQISEGVIWMALSDPAYAHYQQAGTNIFLFIARVLWPVTMPLAVLVMEEDIRKKKIILPFVLLGSTVSVYYTYCLLFLNVTPNIAGNHIQYISDYPESLAVPVFIIYFAASLTPLFISSVQGTKLFGALLFVSAIVTVIAFTEYLTSVWCFFAAIMSVIVYRIVSGSVQKQLTQSHKGM